MDCLRHSELVYSVLSQMYIYTCMYHVVLDEFIRFVTESVSVFDVK